MLPPQPLDQRSARSSGLNPPAPSDGVWASGRAVLLLTALVSGRLRAADPLAALPPRW